MLSCIACHQLPFQFLRILRFFALIFGNSFFNTFTSSYRLQLQYQVTVSKLSRTKASFFRSKNWYQVVSSSRIDIAHAIAFLILRKVAEIISLPLPQKKVKEKKKTFQESTIVGRFTNNLNLHLSLAIMGCIPQFVTLFRIPLLSIIIVHKFSLVSLRFLGYSLSPLYKRISFCAFL